MDDQANTEYANFVNTLFDSPEQYLLPWFQRRGHAFYIQYRKEKLAGFWDVRKKPTDVFPSRHLYGDVVGVDYRKVDKMEQAYLKSLPYFH